MRRRIWKELRATMLYGMILVIGTFSVALWTINSYTSGFSYGGMEDLSIFENRLNDACTKYIAQWTGWFTVEYVGLLLITVGLLGTEYRDNSLGRLLAQPITRRQLLLEKIAAYWFVSLILVLIQFGTSLYLFFYLKSVMADYLPKFKPELAHLKPHVWAAATAIREWLPVIGIHLSIGIVALANGLLASLFIRQAHTAFWAALVFPIGIGMFLLALVPVLPGHEIGGPWIVGGACLWVVMALIVSWIKFKRLEV